MILQADAGYADDGSPHTPVSIDDVEVDSLTLSGISGRYKPFEHHRIFGNTGNIHSKTMNRPPKPLFGQRKHLLQLRQNQNHNYLAWFRPRYTLDPSNSLPRGSPQFAQDFVLGNIRPAYATRLDCCPSH